MRHIWSSHWFISARKICRDDGRGKTCRIFVAYCEVTVHEKHSSVPWYTPFPRVIPPLLITMKFYWIVWLSIAGLFLAENDLCMCKEGTV
jgi:hypothetical protein